MAFLPLHVAAMLLVTAVCLGIIGLGLHEDTANYRAFAWGTALGGFALIAYARYALRLPWISASIVYLGLLWIFHFGMTLSTELAPNLLDDFADWQLEWLYLPNTRIAMLLGILGMVGFLLGVGFFWGPGSEDTKPKEMDTDMGLFVGGWISLVVGIIVTVAVLVQYLGFGLLGADYGVFLELAQTTYLGTALGLAHLGCLMAICGAPKGRWLKPFGLWLVVIVLPVLALGSRAASLTALVGFGVILTHRGVHFNRGFLAAVGALLLFVVPAIEAFRHVGFENRESVQWSDVTPLDTFMELGGSLQATRAYIDWIEDGDPLQLGATYWAPFDRQVFIRMMPWRVPVDFENDDRFPERLMPAREGPFGGSSTGEAYYNFGASGPLIFGFFMGLLFGWLERRWASTPKGAAVLGAIMLVLFFHIRGGWLAVPLLIAEGLAMVAACSLLGRLVLREGDRGVAPAEHAPAR